MCPKSQIKRQSGYLMPMAIFIIVIMGGLALTISRFSGQMSIATVQEAVAVQTFFAAESGAQLAMHQLLFDSTQSIIQVLAQANCGNLTTPPLLPIQLTGAGLNSCTVALTCSFTIEGVPQSISYFSITSAAECGSGTVKAQRSVKVTAFLE
jgi:MSHA biogenesis protein MshP